MRGWPFLALLVVGELGARLAGFGADPRFLETCPHEHLQRVPLPDQEQLVGRDDPETGEQRVSMRINALGQRGPDYPLEKQPGEIRVIGLGDSLTFGRGVATDETYLTLLDADCGPARAPPVPSVRAYRCSKLARRGAARAPWARMR